MSSGNPERALVSALKAQLRKRGDPRRAPAMQAYMRSAMPFAGVSSPMRREICREQFALHPLSSAARWSRAVRDLWRSAEYREERYAAVDLLLARRYREFLTLDVLALVEELIVTGAWWDYVDSIASHALGKFIADNPVKTKEIIRAWSRDRDLWKRRSAILSQLGAKRDTDLELLYETIDRNLDDPDFFIRKAIGWALRQYAWTDPKEVKRKVKELGPRLSPLSRREAMKNLGASKPRKRA